MTTTLRRALLTQQEANYRDAENPSERCGTCSMFIPPALAGRDRAAAEQLGRCTLVQGGIDPDYTCDHWAPLGKGNPILPASPGPPYSHHEHVRTLVLDAAGRLLLLQRKDRPAQWEPVQGTEHDTQQDAHETAFQTAQRELEEETGYGGASLRWERLGPRTWVVHLPPDAGAPTLSPEHLAYRWTSVPEADLELARERFYGGFLRKQDEGDGSEDSQQEADDLSARIFNAAEVARWDELARLITPPLGEGAAEGVLHSAADTGLGPDDLRVANTRALDWAAARAAQLVTNVSETTRNGLRDLVSQALEEGWSPQELQQEIEGSALFSPARAAMIARTELAMAHSQGTLAGWAASDVVAKKRWLLAPQHVGPDECDDNADVGAIALEDSFPSGDDGPPAHPNCLCVVVPEVGEEEAEKVLKFAADQLRDEHGRFYPEGADVKRHRITGDHAIITAENPGGQPATARINQARNARLLQELRTRGYDPVRVSGVYTDPTSGHTLTEHSFLVPGMQATEAKDLGKRWGQNGVLTHAGYHDLVTGQLAPMSGYVSVGKSPYTELPGGRRLRGNIDWTHPIADRLAAMLRAWSALAHVQKARSMYYEFAPFEAAGIIADAVTKVYTSIDDLPASQTKGFTEHEKHIFLAAWNAAYKEYGQDESKAFAVAHAAVNRHRGEARKYSPEQPRDYHGRFGEGGARNIYEPEHGNTITNSNLRARFQAQMHSGEQAGPGDQTDPNAPGWVGHVIPAAKAPASLRAMVVRVAARQGWDPRSVTYVDKAPLIIQGNGIGSALGQFDPEKKTINVFTDRVLGEGTLAHEGFHLQMDAVTDAARREGWSSGGPHADLINRYYNDPAMRERLVREDGLSAYSHHMWNMVMEGEVPPPLAVEETLADYERIATTYGAERRGGVAPANIAQDLRREDLPTQRPTYTAFRNEIQALYRKLPKAQKAGTTLPATLLAPLVIPMTRDWQPTEAGTATFAKVIYPNGRRVFLALEPGPVQKYRPDQMRDAHGKWTFEGPAATSTQTYQGEERRYGPRVGPSWDMLRQVGKGQPAVTPMDTLEVKGARRLYAMNPTSTASINTPEREALRARLANDDFIKVKNPKADRQAWVIVGHAGAGKTSIGTPIAKANGAHLIDADAVMERLPEYRGYNANNLHEEASQIVSRTFKKAVSLGHNVVLTTIGRDPVDTASLANGLAAQGYQIHAIHAQLPAGKAAQRAVERFYHTGRLVDPDYILHMVGDDAPRRSFNTLAQNPATVSAAVVSTDVPVGHAPRVVGAVRRR
jgi:predicted kinase/8-oxo-dGTP pyrophosphatase MutT (NUDIX family)/cation transport regulator ChaB